MTLTEFVILSFAAWRVTRFVYLDSMIEEPRNAVWLWLETRAVAADGWRSAVWHKIHDGATCAFCISVWMAALVFWPWAAISDYDIGWVSIIDWLAVCGGAMLVYRIIDPE